MLSNTPLSVLLPSILGACAAVGWTLAWFLHRKSVHLEKELRCAEQAREQLACTLARSQTELETRQLLAEQWMTQARATFSSMASEVLQQSQSHLLQLAEQNWTSLAGRMQQDWASRAQELKTGVDPVTSAVERLESKLLEVERLRSGAYEGLQGQIGQLMLSERRLHIETTKLVQALRAPQVRGRWGEMQLRRVVELAGMLAHCDFAEQQHLQGEEGRLRPDLVVHLPGGRSIVIDAKTPLDAYLQAQDELDEERRAQALCEHARRVRQHIHDLSRKAYWAQFEQSPEYVILFLPGEPFYSAALQADPSLLDAGVEQHVLIATPTTLIALLRAAAFGWRQEQLSQHAQSICQLGKELHKRLGDTLGHVTKCGKSLDEAVRAYNKAVGSMESRVLVTARKFQELQEIEQPLPTLHQVENTSRPLRTLASATEVDV